MKVTAEHLRNNGVMTDAKILLALAIFIAQSPAAAASCSDQPDCESCAKSDFSWLLPISCRWCPLTNACHAPASFKNPCTRKQCITDKQQCRKLTKPSENYSPRLAAKLARFSSLAYVQPDLHTKTSIRKVVRDYISPNYQVIKFLTADCDHNFQYGLCGAVVAKSRRDKEIVVAYEGTSSTKQLIEQVLILVHGLKDFRPTGGEILPYNYQVHHTLYPCVKSVVQDLLSANPSYKVLVTGHSLGGALAQLTAAALVKDRVVAQSKLHVYTFGSPRVGDKDFAYGYDQLVANSWRVVRSDDLIPRLVPKRLFGFPFTYHTKKEILYKTTGSITTSSRYIKCRANEDASCVKPMDACITGDCISQIRADHANYFLPSLPHYLSRKMSAAKIKQVASIGNVCHSYSFV